MALEKTVAFVVITPERQVLEECTESLVIPAHDGELGVLFGRAPLMCELGIGQLRYRQGDRTRRMFIDGGFAQVAENHVTVLTTDAVVAEQITGEMIAEAERSVEQERGSGPEAVEARCLAQRRVSVMRSLRGAR